MELVDLISGQSPSIALALTLAYFYNQNYLASLRERKEILERILVERKEWADEINRLVDRYDARLAVAVEAATQMREQMHALRGKVTEFMLTLDTRLARLEQGTRGDKDGR